MKNLLLVFMITLVMAGCDKDEDRKDTRCTDADTAEWNARKPLYVAPWEKDYAVFLDGITPVPLGTDGADCQDVPEVRDHVYESINVTLDDNVLHAVMTTECLGEALETIWVLGDEARDFDGYLKHETDVFDTSCKFLFSMKTYVVADDNPQKWMAVEIDIPSDEYDDLWVKNVVSYWP